MARTHARPLAAVAIREGLTSMEAIDAVQEAFLTLLSLPQARELSQDDDGAARLMAVLVRNAARNIRRRHHRARPHDALDVAEAVAENSPSVDELLATAEEHVAMLGCVRKLAEMQQHVVTMRFLEELTPHDTATALGLTPTHVNVLLFRAKRALMDCLKEMTE
jgi:RNA polymerase sigma-70 factor (ECF subfamily)